MHFPLSKKSSRNCSYLTCIVMLALDCAPPSSITSNEKLWTPLDILTLNWGVSPISLPSLSSHSQSEILPSGSYDLEPSNSIVAFPSSSELTVLSSPASATGGRELKESSSIIMLADLPPNSCATLLTVTAAPLATAIPAHVDPVKDIISMLG